MPTCLLPLPCIHVWCSSCPLQSRYLTFPQELAPFTEKHSALGLILLILDLIILSSHHPKFTNSFVFELRSRK